MSRGCGVRWRCWILGAIAGVLGLVLASAPPHPDAQVRITTAVPTKVGHGRSNALRTPLGHAFTCYAPPTPDQAPSSSDVAQVLDTSLTLRTDPRRVLLSNDILLCEVPFRDEHGRVQVQIYAMLGSVMVPHESLTRLRDGDALRSVSDIQEIDMTKAESERLAKAKEDDPLLSFDEWKEQHLEKKRKRKGEKSKDRGAQHTDETTATKTSTAFAPSEAIVPISTSQAPSSAPHNKSGSPEAGKSHPPPVELGPPHIYAMEDATAALAELKHRWNYASLDCAAMLHQANPQAKFAHAILSEKKDKYMLSPCPQPASQNHRDARPLTQFVVVELCQQIRVDTIVLANLEFFSSMFKTFRVRAARSLDAPESEWRSLGLFHARNARGFQVFKLTGAPQSYFRFLRIDFLEHYGTEYYCPVSLLRVYGRNEREDADEDMLDEMNALEDEEGEDEEPVVPSDPILELTSSHVAVGDYIVERACVREPFPGVWRAACERVMPVVLPPPPPPLLAISSSATSNGSAMDALSETSLDALAPALIDTSPTTCTLPATTSVRPANDTETKKTHDTKTTKHKASNKPGDTKGGESIYRSITKRLAALEANTSLSMQYLQLSSQKLRDKLTVLEQMHETRLAELFAAMNATFARQWEDKMEQHHVALRHALTALDAQQHAYHQERAQFLARIDRLAADVRSEKRWGMAQLVLMLSLLLILALTRDSPRMAAAAAAHVSEPYEPPSLLNVPPSGQASPVAAEPWETTTQDARAARPETLGMSPRPVASLKNAHRRFATSSPKMRVRRIRAAAQRVHNHTPDVAYEWIEKEHE